MKTLRLFGSLSAAVVLASAAFAADPTGTWKWATHSPSGDIPTTLKLEAKDGHLTGAYSNQFGDTAISNGTLKDDVITFDVVRNLGGGSYVVKYRGKLEGDTIKGTIEAPGHDGGDPVKLEWNARRVANEPSAAAKPKR